MFVENSLRKNIFRPNKNFRTFFPKNFPKIFGDTSFRFFREKIGILKFFLKFFFENFKIIFAPKNFRENFEIFIWTKNTFSR